jgi:DNA-binding NarL/FixJ family response regulator
MDGVQATKEIMKMDPDANIYGFTAYFDTDMSRELERAGAKKIIPRHEGFTKFVDEIKKFFGYQ